MSKSNGRGARLGLKLVLLTGVFACGLMPHGSAFNKAFFYQEGPAGGGGSALLHHLHFILFHGEHLGLNEEQIAALQDLKLGIQKKIARQDVEITILNLESEAALQKTTVDVKMVQDLAKQKFERMLQKEMSLIQAWADLKGVLSQDQHGLLADLWQERALTPQGESNSK